MVDGFPQTPHADGAAPPAGGPPAHHPIVIAGGGLGGLTLGCALATYGVPAVLLDEDAAIGGEGGVSRGICYTQKSLEIFDRLGVFGPMAARGVQWSVGRTFAGEDEVYAFDLRQQGGFHLSAQPPFLNLQQFHVEAILAARIRELGHVELRPRSRVTGLSQDGEGALLQVETPAGTYALRADHVIDATGSQSPLRAWAGATVQARRGEDRWCIADVRFAQQLPVERRTWIEAPFNENRAVWQHLLADGVWRIDYQMAPDADPAEACSEAAVRRRLARQFGSDAGVEIVSISPYTYRSECVDRMRHGRVFFLGDAAKVVYPFGARGGNSAIADADNLAWKLAAVLAGRASPALLDSYDDERREAAEQNLRVTERAARFLRPASGPEALFRDATVGLARQHAFARQLVNTGRMAAANTYTGSGACDPGGGLPVPNARLAWPDGSAGTVNDLLRWAGGRLLVLVFGDPGAAGLDRLRQLAGSAPIRCVQVLGPDEAPGAIEFVRDPQGHLQGACHVFGHAWALVRPDSYLAATGEAVDAALVHAVGRALGAQLEELP